MTGGREPGAATAGRVELLLGVGFLILGFLVWVPVPAGVWHDDGVYVMLGRALAAGEGLVYLGVPDAPAAPKFPPVYPAVLAALWTLLRSVGRVAVAAEALNVVFLATAALVFVRLLELELGLDRRWAVGTTVAAWLSVDLWQYALVPLSEALFVLLLLVCLRWAVRLERRPDVRTTAIFVALATLLVHTRTAGVVVVGAAGLALLSRGRLRYGVAVLAGVGALMVPWTLWTGAAARSIPGPLRDILGPYGPWLVEQVVSDPAVFLAGVPGAASDLLERVLRLLLPGVPLGLRWAAAAGVVPALAAGLILVGRRSRAVALTVLLYLGILLLWPFQDRRLVMPSIPLLFAALGVLAAELGRWSGWWRPGPAPGDRPGEGSTSTVTGRAQLGARVAVAVMALWLVGYGAVSSYRLARGYAAAGFVVRAEALRAAEEAVVLRTPVDAVVGAPELWAALHLYTGRSVAPSARFLPARAREGSAAVGEPAEQWELWWVAGLDYLVVEHGGRVHGPALDALEERCPGSVFIEARLPDGFLVRLAWDDACRRAVLPPG